MVLALALHAAALGCERSRVEPKPIVAPPSSAPSASAPPAQAPWASASPSTTASSAPPHVSASPHGRGDAGAWELSADDFKEILRLAAHEFQDAKGALRYESDGHESYETTMHLGGCGDPGLWKRPSGVWEFRCKLVPYGKREKSVSAELDRRLDAVVALLPPDWKVERFPKSEPYQSRIKARDPSRRLLLDASMTPYQDGTFDATLSLTAGIDPTP